MKKAIFLSVLIVASAFVPAKAYDFMAGGFAYNYLGAYVGDANAANVEVVCTSYLSNDNYNTLTTANIPSTVTWNKKTYKVTSIGNFAFGMAQKLTSVSIPSSVENVARGAFYGCPLLKTVTMANGVKSLGDFVFDSCEKLTSIVIPNSVTNLGQSAFFNCTSLGSVTLSNALTEIKNSSFRYCSSLTSITIPNSVKTIGETVFYGSDNLKTVNLSNTLTSIGDYAFGDCTSITSLVIPNTVTSIGFSAFYNCSSMKSLTLSSNLTSVSDELFYGCTSLQSVVMGESVTSIGEKAFYNTGLTSITIPSTVKSIGSLAFWHCYNLTQVRSKIVDVSGVEMSNNVFNLDTYEKGTLTVPVGTVRAYRRANGWKEFATIVDEEGNTDTGGIVGDVNGDDKIDVGDLNTMLNILLSGGYDAAADLNGDNKIDVSDINGLINIILSL